MTHSTDYSTYLDAETWAFIRRSAGFFPADANLLTIKEQRQLYNTMCRAFFAGYPPGVVATDSKVKNIPIRVYEMGSTDNGTGTETDTKIDTNVMYLHGGGFVVGDLNSHDDICAEIAARTGFRVISADYRLCPEHPHPAAFQDALKVTQYVTLTWPGTLILAGDSAGANLAAAVSHYARGVGHTQGLGLAQGRGPARGALEIAGQVLIYGAFGGDMNQGTYLTHAQAPMLSRDEIIYYMELRSQGQPPSQDITAAPLQDDDFSNLPPTVLISAECDPVSGDSRDYYTKITAQGGRAVWVNEPGLVHGYLRGRHSIKRAGASFTRIIRAITTLGAHKPFPRDL